MTEQARILSRMRASAGVALDCCEVALAEHRAAAPGPIHVMIHAAVLAGLLTVQSDLRKRIAQIEAELADLA